ncbi:Uncharacterized protein TCM_038106 [Theobroma cacao]|uniref:Uncharacterized protein n=1 Tax=Theobroma cacao TaxID=3641 RepID=A0A061GMK5_THECC|nr:Uncharacterized protein TCM_038106 [Theobroma cacao]
MLCCQRYHLRTNDISNSNGSNGLPRPYTSFFFFVSSGKMHINSALHPISNI